MFLSLVAAAELVPALTLRFSSYILRTEIKPRQHIKLRHEKWLPNIQPNRISFYIQNRVPFYIQNHFNLVGAAEVVPALTLRFPAAEVVPALTLRFSKAQIAAAEVVPDASCLVS